MKKLAVYGAALFALASFARDARAGHGYHSRSTSVHEHGVVQSCEDVNVRFGDRDTLTGEARLTIPRSEVSTLDVSPSRNGGIWVQGTEGPDFLVTLCKAVPDEDGAQARLDRIALSRQNDRLTVSGPDDDDWCAHVIVRAPSGSSIHLDSENGPVGLHDFSGSAKIDSQNGPVSLLACRGKITVDSQNGPIHVSESSGNVTLDARNGPLSVRLAEGGWKGGQLDGRTENGPLHVELPRQVGAGVRVESAGRSPFQCRGDACRDARRNWDDDSRRIEFGTAEALVRLSTVNGPVSIDSGN